MVLGLAGQVDRVADHHGGAVGGQEGGDGSGGVVGGGLRVLHDLAGVAVVGGSRPPSPRVIDTVVGAGYRLTLPRDPVTSGRTGTAGQYGR